jgi:hypothetical protein
MVPETPPLECIRQAVASGEFEKALLLWNGYAEQLEEELREYRLSAAQFQEMGELVEWARSVVQCARAHDQDLLNSICAAGRYSDPPAPASEPHILQIRL